MIRLKVKTLERIRVEHIVEKMVETRLRGLSF